MEIDFRVLWNLCNFLFITTTLTDKSAVQELDKEEWILCRGKTSDSVVEIRDQLVKKLSILCNEDRVKRNQ